MCSFNNTMTSAISASIVFFSTVKRESVVILAMISRPMNYYLRATSLATSFFDQPNPITKSVRALRLQRRRAFNSANGWFNFSVSRSVTSGIGFTPPYTSPWLKFSGAKCANAGFCISMLGDTETARDRIIENYAKSNRRTQNMAALFMFANRVSRPW